LLPEDTERTEKAIKGEGPRVPALAQREELAEWLLISSEAAPSARSAAIINSPAAGLAKPKSGGSENLIDK
jgi:hypothetical protein